MRYSAVSLFMVVGVEAGPLNVALGAPEVDARRAQRALVLALQAELAGDPAGARAAVEALAKDADTPAESVGRALLDAWLGSQATRLPAWSKSAGRAEVVRAWSSLEPFGPELRDRAWHHFLQSRPELEQALPPVQVRIDRSAGDPPDAVHAVLAKTLGHRGLLVGPGRFELGVDYDATERSNERRRVRIRAKLSFVLTTTAAPPVPVARFFRARSEARKTEAGARRFVLRRLATDAARSVAWALRREALARIW